MQSNNKRKQVEIKSLIFNNHAFNTNSTILNIFNENCSRVGKNIDKSIHINDMASNPQNISNSSIIINFSLDHQIASR